MSRRLRLSKQFWKTVPRFIVLAGASAFILGCAGLGPRLGGIRVDRVSRGAVEVASVHVYGNQKGGILVSGDVRKRVGYLAPIQSHLDVLALNREGRVVASLATRYLPSPIPNVRRGVGGHASYAVDLPVNPDAVNVIQVAHHEASLGKCELPKEGELYAPKEVRL